MLIDHKKPLALAGVFDVSDLLDRVWQLYRYGFERGLSTGWAELDQFYTVRPGELTVVTGIPNSGKSNFLDALLVNLARERGWNFALFSPENQPLEDHMARMVEKFVRKPFAKEAVNRMTEQELEEGLRSTRDHFSWMLPVDDSDWTIDKVLELAGELVKHRKINGLVIDPWNELEHQLLPGQIETIYVGNVLKRIRRFARRHSVHVWIVAHPGKLYRDKNDGKYPVPTLYDISGSANWRNKSDNGISVWRDFSDDSKAVKIHVQKVRFRQTGTLGVATLKYQPSTATYDEFGFHNSRP